MILYLDTSTVLRVLLRQPAPLAGWGKWGEAYSSEILGVEARRAIDRLRLDGILDDAGVADAQEELRRIEATIGWIVLSRPVLRRAAQPMATSVKTLDAIHLASAWLLETHLGARIIFATHDARQGMAARGLGFDCTGL